MMRAAMKGARPTQDPDSGAGGYTVHKEEAVLINIIAWIVLGAIAGYLAGMLVKGDERWGIIGHVVLGIVGAFVGGFIALQLGLEPGAAFGGDKISIVSIIVAVVVGAVIVVWVVKFDATRRRPLDVLETRPHKSAVGQSDGR